MIDIFSKYAWVVPLKDKKGVKKIKKVSMLFKKYWKNLIENQTKYGLMKEANFKILLKNG